MRQWTHWLWGKEYTLASLWWMAIGTVLSFAVCLAGSPPRPEPRGFPVLTEAQDASPAE
jgi:hypothetical protein